MKILMVHNRYRPAAPSGENVVVDQESAALAGRGHEVSLFQRLSEDIARWSIPRRATLPLRVLWSADSYRDIRSRLLAFKPDVVHVHNTFPLITPSVLYACRDAAVPVVVTVHNYRLGCASGELFRDGQVCHDCLDHSPLPAVAHGCYRGSRLATTPVVIGSSLHADAWRTLVSAYVFISSAQRELLRPVGMPADRSFVKHNFVPAPSIADPTTRHQVAYVGRLDEAKGATVLMRAWEAFRARRTESSLHLVVAGGGSLASAVSDWSARNPSVTMAGHVPRSEVAEILGASRAVIVPSQWEETFGMVAVEAMAAGTAVIASAHGALPEIVTSGIDGATFAPTDVDALVDLIEDVDDEPRRWDQYGDHARSTYRRRFTIDASIDQLVDIYRFAVEKRVVSAGTRSRRPRPFARSSPEVAQQ